MQKQVLDSIGELKLQFPDSELVVREDALGGAYVLIERVSLAPRFAPQQTWIGFQIPALYPYADIYPVFIGGNVTRVDNVCFVAPITPGHIFEGRPALQISRRTSTVAVGSAQKATTKILKILNFIDQMP